MGVVRRVPVILLPPLLTSPAQKINKNIDLCLVWVPQKEEEGLKIDGHWQQVVVKDEDEDKEDWDKELLL